MSRVYISGPITGIPDYNRPAFAAAARALENMGHEPVNPHDVTPFDPHMDWADYLRNDLIALLGCDAITMLPGAHNSRGAALERHVADALGFPHIEIEWL